MLKRTESLMEDGRFGEEGVVYITIRRPPEMFSVLCPDVHQNSITWPRDISYCICIIDQDFEIKTIAKASFICRQMYYSPEEFVQIWPNMQCLRNLNDIARQSNDNDVGKLLR